MNRSSIRYHDEHLAKEKGYWLQKLSGDLVVTGIPLDYSRPATWQNEKAVIDIELDSDIQSKLQKVCGGKGPLIFTVLVAVLKIVLHKYTRIEDVIVGTAVESRYKGLASPNQVLALRDHVSGSHKVGDLLGNVKQTTSEAYANQKYSFKRLLELLKIESPSNRAPLFNVVILIDSIHDRESVRDLKEDVTLIFSGSNGVLSGVIEFSPVLFKRETIEVFAEHYKRVLHAVLNCPGMTISEIELLSADRKSERVFDFNKTEFDYPNGKTIHQLFQEQAALTPGEVAVVHGASQLTYYELNNRANQLAHYLRKLGVACGRFVGLFMDRSIELIVGLLGILKAGGAYLPFDSAHPRTRLAFMLEDAQISLVLTQQRLADRLASYSGDILCLDSDWEVAAQESEQCPDGEACADDLAYLIYTSGSTGKPKGIKIQHRSLVNYVWWAKDVYVQGERVAFPLYSSPAFDLTVTSIFTPLITGNRIVIYHWEGRDLFLEEIIKDGQINIIKLTPSHLSLIKDKDNRRSRIKRLIVGGEALEKSLAQQVLKSFGGDVEIFNEYGPTEATVGCMIYKFDPVRDDRAFVPIGRPAANVQIYVLDEDLRPIADNVIGELYISGDGLSEGYLNREELTEERFIKNPFLKGRRMYKTGDLARWLPDKVLEYVGRTDDQVKFHGYRVEMNEIRCALNLHSQVKDSVILLKKDSHGHDVMVAYYVSSQELAAAQLRSFMAESIIEETIPNLFVHLPKLPLTLNGKINYGALLDLKIARSGIDREGVAASTATEKQLAAIWSQVLRIEQVGIHDNFFDLGGHSLLATQVMSRVKETFCVELPLRTLFEAPTVAAFTERLEAATNADGRTIAPPITLAPRDNTLPLSFAQQRLWFLDQLVPNHPFYNISGAARIVGRLDLGALEESLNEIVARHEALRTTFKAVDGKPVQVIAKKQELSFELVELSGGEVEQRLERAKQIANQEAKTAFNLERGPLLRVKVVRIGAEDHVAIFTMHHIVSDEWSIGVLVREMGEMYGERAAGRQSGLEKLPIQYADFAVWQREWLQGEALEQELEYWRKQLAGMPDLGLPTDHPRPATPSYRGARQHFMVEKDLAEKLRALSQREGATLFMTLLTVFKAMLYRYSWQEDIPVATGIANRNRHEIENLIGFFINMLVLRTDLSGNPTFTELLARVREVALGAYAHQDVPFDLLVAELRPERHLSRTPLFQVVFVLLNAPQATLELPGVTLAPFKFESEITHFDLTMSVEETPQGLAGDLEYDTDLFEPETIVEMLKNYTILLEAMVEHPEQRVLEIPLHLAEESYSAPDFKLQIIPAEKMLEHEQFPF